ncbi:hypothetical protein ESA94_11015 [Lacibacter luteus]|uniref:O-antigen ligase domain-containing protein n=1 Tax=Lacibacter luteus TaxID=2508719 RepID=A0A4Q1CK10_9BACT|nr:hypothetical protein [Lacibacter luteus]RXK60976.1 hypothetical protein ESA94_11015 [Lacibacter luteus]
MAVGFLCSRLLLSIGTISLITNAFIQGNLKERFQQFISDKLSIGISCLFLLPFISGLWSSDKQEWVSIMQDKLPLLLLPFALISQKGIERKQLLWFKLFWIGLMFGGSVWSAVQYAAELQYFNNAYQFSQTIPTPAANDHIRFSMGIVIALLFWLKIEEWKAIASKLFITTIRVAVLWLTIYLHILGAKTGLLGLYVVVLPLLILQLYKSGKQKAAAVALAAVLFLPLLSYALLPTFRVRVHYVLFEQVNWNAQEFAGRFSDANRWTSIQSGWYLFKQNWLGGVGYGDIKTQAGVWYASHASEVAITEQFLPLNQWMMSGSGAGILAVLLFTAVAFMPLFLEKWKHHKQALAFVLFMNLVFLYESTIDDQFGVFLYCFFILYWNCTINLEKNELLKCNPSPL